ncbi:DUF2239 family protein [Gynuella sp.]|uniref:DUF2239 family protein n=1 Tax=Gynuella sp. TaxID=2969146 RepID=UPI003D0BF442
MKTHYSAFYQNRLIAQGSLETVVEAVKQHNPLIEPLLLETESCQRKELDWRGEAIDVLNRLNLSKTTQRGRPKLGVEPKEVTLLPRHWEWLARQSGGASVTLRKLVEAAIKQAPPEQQMKERQERLYRFLSLTAGDFPAFEEVIRALYRNNRQEFEQNMCDWPEDIRTFALNKFDELGVSNDH